MKVENLIIVSFNIKQELLSLKQNGVKILAICNEDYRYIGAYREYDLKKYSNLYTLIVGDLAKEILKILRRKGVTYCLIDDVIKEISK